MAASTGKQYEQFCRACAEGRLNDVREWLDQGMSADGHSEMGDYERPLVQALYNEQLEAAELLRNAGAQPRFASCFLSEFSDRPDHRQWVDRIIADATPELSENYQAALSVAVEHDNRELAERLLPACPEPHQFSSNRTPLCEALRMDLKEMALWLIDLGFDHRSQHAGETPAIVWAVIGDHEDVLQKLIASGESPKKMYTGTCT